jgi:hypothetical protein
MPRTPKARNDRENSPDIQVGNKAADYKVEMSESAAGAYAAYFDRAETARARGDVASYHITALNMIDEVIEKIIPRDPFNRRYVLTGKLSRIFRMQKGRMRIAWIGSSEKRNIYILFISETAWKAGDVNDPYRLLTNMLLSGEFEAIFAELGLKPPNALRVQSSIPQ